MNYSSTALFNSVTRTIKNLDHREFAKPTALSTELTCCICFKLFENPFTLKCGHTFCCQCLKDYTKYVCPVDQTPYKLSEFQLSSTISEIVSKIPLICPGDSDLKPNETDLNEGIDIKSIRSLLKCLTCEEYLESPVTLPCGHTICDSCMKWHYRRVCPIDRTFFGHTGSSFSKDITLTEIINIINQPQNQSNPLSKKSGAHHGTLNLSDWSLHVEHCLYVPIKCECGKQIKRHEFDDVSLPCECRLTSCRNCKKKIPMRCKESHEALCSRDYLKKPQRCKEMVCKKDKEEECFEPKVQKKVHKEEGNRHIPISSQ